MGDAHEWAAFVGGNLTPFGGVGLALAILLIVVVRLFLPREQVGLWRMPLYLLIAHLVTLFAYDLLPESELLAKELRFLSLLFLLLSIARSGFLFLANIAARKAGRSFPTIFRDIVQGIIFVLALFLTLRASGVDPSSILTTSALLTAVVGLSLQDTLGNLFAGLAIQAQTPFEVGDWIQYDEVKTHVGQVLEINWRATKMRTIDDVEVIVPNSKLATAAISNYSKPTKVTRRSVIIHGPYSAPPLRIKQVLLSAVKAVPSVLDDPPPDINSVGYDEYGIQYQIRFYIDRYDERLVIDGDVLDRVWYALRRADLPLPVPQRRITMLQHSNESQKVAQLEAVAERERSLHHVDFLSCLPDELFHELAERCEKRLYAAGEAIIRQGEAGSELFIIESGEVEILIEKRVTLTGTTIPPPAKDGSVTNKKNGRVREVKVAELGAGRFFGELSLLTGEERNATVRAKGEVTVLVVSKEDLAPIFEASPELLERISNVLSERAEASGQQDDDLDFDDVHETGRQSVLLSRIRKFFSL